MKYPALKLRCLLLGCCGFCLRRLPADRLSSLPYSRKLACDKCLEERDETHLARPAVLPCPPSG